MTVLFTFNEPSTSDAESLTPRESVNFSNRFLTISNLLSILRVLLTVPFIIVMFSSMQENRLWGGVIIAIAALTDKLDGVLARRLDEVTEWGKILDPLADKFAIAVATIVLLLLHAIPLWLVIVIVVRDVMILAGGMYLKSQRGIVPQSNEVGKWAVGSISLTLFLLVIGIQSIVTDVLIAATVALLFISSLLYVRRFIEVMKGANFGNA